MVSAEAADSTASAASVWWQHVLSMPASTSHFLKYADQPALLHDAGTVSAEC